MKAAVFLAVAGIALIEASCPNACSGKGQCGIKDACACFDGYTGADCSQRLCAFDFAFVDSPKGDLNHDGVVSISSSSAAVDVAMTYSKVQWSSFKQAEGWPTVAGAAQYVDATTKRSIDSSKIVGGGWAAGADEAHFYAECSGKGFCSRDTGLCSCYDGYTGAACQRTVCASDCSGHGMCRTVNEIARGALNKRFSQSAAGYNYYTGAEAPFVYRLWDSEKHTACICDAGYTGSDCSLRSCPRGNDPLSAVESKCGNAACRNEVQGFTLSKVNAKAYYVQFTTFDGFQYLSDDFTIYTDDTTPASILLAHEKNVASVKAALQSIPGNVTGAVKVTSGFDAISNIRILVEFVDMPGNIPEFEVLSGRTGGGVNPVTQPSRPVQTFAVPAGSTGTIRLTLYPLDPTGFRAEQFTSAAVSAGDFTNAAALKTSVELAVKGTTAGVAALGYKVPETMVVVTGANTGTGYKVMLFFPNKNFGSASAKLTIGVNSYPGLLDTFDGNKEYRVCSDRGLCDYAAGLCKCFPGYVGAACQTQNALAM